MTSARTSIALQIGLHALGFLLLLASRIYGIDYSANRSGYLCLELAGATFGAAMTLAVLLIVDIEVQRRIDKARRPVKEGREAT